MTRFIQRAVVFVALPALLGVAAAMAVGYAILAIAEDSAPDF